MPALSAGALPAGLPLAKICTVLLASTVPRNVGVVTLVRLSVLETPVSLAASKSGTDGAAGAVVSMTNAGAIAAEFAETLPAASVARAVIVKLPSANALVVIE